MTKYIDEAFERTFAAVEREAKAGNTEAVRKLLAEVHNTALEVAALRIAKADYFHDQLLNQCPDGRAKSTPLTSKFYVGIVRGCRL